jgi:hypothetical protein
MSDPDTRPCGAKTGSEGVCGLPRAKGRFGCHHHAGAPVGARNGNWRGGRYSRVATREERRQAWREYWIAKRAKRDAVTAPLIDVLDREIPSAAIVTDQAACASARLEICVMTPTSWCG